MKNIAVAKTKTGEFALLTIDNCPLLEQFKLDFKPITSRHLIDIGGLLIGTYRKASWKKLKKYLRH